MLVRVMQQPLTAAIKKSSTQTKWFNSTSWQRCNFCSQKIPTSKLTNVTQLPPLSEPVPNLPTAIYSTTKEEHQLTHITVLPNGLKVASEERFGQFCSIGVLVDSGTRYEVAYPSGVGSFLEKLAFHSTRHYKNEDHINLVLEEYGGMCDRRLSRDTFIYGISADRRGMDTIVQVLSETALRPQITDEEVMKAKQAIEFEMKILYSNPEQELILMDMIHEAAYNNNTLGLPQLCPTENLDKINRLLLFTYLKHHYTPERMVVAGVGVDHQELVEAVNKYFVDQKPIWEEQDNLTLPDVTGNLVDKSIAQYTGGYILEDCKVPVYAGSSGLPELSHLVIGLESCSHQDPDFVPLCVLNVIMGGGSSFSTGGPGKGMFARLYTNVLNRHSWLYSATALNHSYADTGLFCIHAAASTNVREMVEVITSEMVGMAQSISENELKRAKKQLQSLVLMNLEQRPVIFEDIGRQVLATGTRKRPEYFIQEIEKVTEADIIRVARRLLKSPPSVAARGDVREIPPIEEIQALLLNTQGRSRSTLQKMFGHSFISK